MDKRITDSAKTAVVSNDAIAARAKFDAKIKTQFGYERKGKKAPTVVGQLFAQGCEAGAYDAADSVLKLKRQTIL